MTIGNNVKSIQREAFQGCTGLECVKIGNGLTSIGYDAFKKCVIQKVIVNDIAAWCGIEGLFELLTHSQGRLYSDENTEIKNLVIPDGVTSIISNAFYGCSGLTSVTIPNSVTSIGDNAFQSCSGLKKVIVKDIAAWCGITFYGYVSNGYESNPLRYAHHLYSDENTEITNLVIPNSVTSIGDHAFYGCSGLTSVTIPNSVTTIDYCAFYYCSGLEKVIVKDIAAWCGISFSDIYGNPLYYAHHLYSDENTEITNLVIPNSVTSIGGAAFCGCSGLTSVTIPNSVTSIGSGAFGRCSGLTSVTIPNSVTSIGDGAFYNCGGLTSMTIPNSVTSIGSGAFNCDNLATVISKIETPFAINGKSSSDPVFSNNTFMNADLFVPVGTIDKYKATQGWKDFVWITEGIPSGVEGVKTDDDKTEVSRYTLDGMILSEPRKGINIIKMSDGTSKKVIIK